jgi:pimeloyl-ACP methyl ester carboxylesterase
VSGLAGTPYVANLPNVTSPSAAACQNYYFPVYVSPGETTVYKVFGQLCTMDPKKLGRQPAQILLNGGTYDHAYWDWPYDPERYSYVRYATERGFTTLNIDRLGYGLSDHPNASMLNFNVAGYVTHQLVEYLRQGALGPRFTTIVLNGYSMGGLTADVEAATYNDVNAVITHAVGHGLITPTAAQRLAGAFYDAELDPKFHNDPWTLGYHTTIPGQRALFYGPPATYDPEILVYEESLKDTLGATELFEIATRSYERNITESIKVPVLSALGRYDKIWCARTDDCTVDLEAENEHTYYRPGVFTEYIVPNAGHAVATSYGGRLFFAETIDWLSQHGIDGNP